MIDRSPALPATIQINYSLYPCVSANWGSLPLYYSQTAALADAGLDVDEEGYDGVLTLYDTAHAVMITTTATVPTNASTLQALTNQIAKDFWGWRLQAFDFVINGVAAPVIDASIDEIEWDYDAECCTTRLKSASWDSHAEFLGHSDPAHDCYASLPVYLSSPKLTIVSGSLKLQAGRVWQDRNLLKWAPTTLDSVVLCPSE
jgi:hypothetical protein